MSTLPVQSIELSPFPVHRFAVEQYRRMGQLGVLTPGDKVELLEGWIVPKTNHNPLHDGTIELVDNELQSLLPSGWRIRIQSVITTCDSEPEPDLAVVRGPAGRYLRAHPTMEDIALIIEVADTSVSKDRLKCRLYARERIASYWIVNLVARQVEVYSVPSGIQSSSEYATRIDYAVDDEIVFRIGDRPDLKIAVSKLIP